jgi:hypothetical protein
MGQQEAIRFLAMEYYLLISNRSFEITITSSAVCGAFVRGAIAGTPSGIMAAHISKDPTILVHPKRLARARAHEPGSPSYLSLHRLNFAISRSAISCLRYDPRPKWGMGTVPHTGRLHVDLIDGKSREFILLGQQDAAALVTAASHLGYPMAAA